MRFRQVHLDFHTSEAIPNIGRHFLKSQFQDMLRQGHVNSITVFSKCHHGWSYHPTEANEMHPQLSFDLLQALIDAAHEIDVKTPVYISAGLDEKTARRHPEWLIRTATDQTGLPQGFLQAGYHELCLNSPYLEVLLKQVEEVVRNYDADGIFLDIVGVRTCYCHTCRTQLITEGKDPRDLSAVRALGERVYANYTNRLRQLVEAIKPGLPVFYNGGHIRRGRRDLTFMNTHLELESLPTGGWGYDHFPLSARYVQTLGLEYLGMTGKFHTTWGEFGGYKHPNALRYEAALSLANGAKCSIGDQLHPEGLMDPATYQLIGAAYQEVAQKEDWCDAVTSIADVALLSVEAAGAHTATGGQSTFTGQSDAGAVRILLEKHILFDVVDFEADFNRYKVLILPDYVRIHPDVKPKIDAFVQSGGKVLATGQSGLWADRDDFAIDLGVKWTGHNPYQPSYVRPKFDLPSLGNAAFVLYSQGQMVELTGGIELAGRENPYFNRDALAFCSHQHTPSNHQYAGPGVVASPNGVYMAWNLFEEYATKGSLIVKEVVAHVINHLLTEKSVETDLPAQGVITVMNQASQNQLVAHLLYAVPVKRGDGIEVIEDIVPIHDVQLTIRVPSAVKRAYLAPQRQDIAFQQEDGRVSLVVPKIDCHQMVVLTY